MEGIDRECRDKPMNSVTVALVLNAGKAYCHHVMKNMTNSGFLEKKGKVNGKMTFQSTGTFVFEDVQDSKDTLSDVPKREAPHIKPRRDPWLFALHVSM